MKQLVQNLKNGKMKIMEVPMPALNIGNILVRVHHSLISAGTEGSKVLTARKGYIGKAKEKPEQVKQVLDTLKKEGLSNTYRKVMNKLDSWAPLGYSCSGEVIAIAPDITHIRIGDKVACAGQDIANHADVVSIPKNLCVKLPQNVTTEAAAYTTVGAIALQGIRQADLRIGESCAVIGLGLLGQLTIQILNASGIKAFGIDLNIEAVKRAKKNGAIDAFERNDSSIESILVNASNGQGVDAVIITAGTSSLDPVDFAGRISRKKGKVIVVGAVPTGFSREIYYKKELELKMSTSYGPGRYDPIYEEQGIDYPYGYVRWTENRNMQAFVDLINLGKIEPTRLTTHHFAFGKADLAFELIMGKKEPFLGIILEYEHQEKVRKNVILRTANNKSKLKIGFIGAGSFAQTFLLPNIKEFNNVSLLTVATTQGHTARTVADRYNFLKASTDAEDILNDININTVFIVTRHNNHGHFVKEAIKNKKNIFVEKPLAINRDELIEIDKLYKSLKFDQRPKLMVGFNRRFAPHIIKIKTKLTQTPMAINYRINAGAIPKEHWTQDAKLGGGRIIGELCHFIDLVIFLNGSIPTHVQAFSIPDNSGLNDSLICNIQFSNGSIASINYLSNGNTNLPKEYLEIHSHGVSVILNDFKELTWYGKRKKREKLINQDKGHKNEIKAFFNSIVTGNDSPIPYNELFASSFIPFAIIDSIREQKIINLDLL